MNKTILKFSIYSGVIASAAELLRLVPLIPSNDIVSELLRFFVFSIISYFAISSFLKRIENSKIYTFLHGVCLTFFICLLGSLISFELNNLFIKIFVSSASVEEFRLAFKLNTIQLIMIVSFVVPLFFISRKKILEDEILDENV